MYNININFFQFDEISVKLAIFNELQQDFVQFLCRIKKMRILKSF